jgi:hypothetical protein
MTGMRFPTALNAHGRGRSYAKVHTFDGGQTSKLTKLDSSGVFLRHSEGAVMSTIEVGELLYRVTLTITGVKEYGVGFTALMAGEVTPPVEGARFDVAFEGTATGPKLSGVAEGIDYIWVRADGRFAPHS